MALIQLKHCSLEVVQIDAPVGAAGSTAPLVFLHEGLGSVEMWHTRNGFWPEQLCLSTARAGMVYSRRGYGRSEDITDIRGVNRLRADYMHREAWEVLPELLEVLGIKRPVLIGHSDGATIALLHAARFDVSACVVMAPHVMVEDVSIRSIQQAREAYLTTHLRDKLSKYHQHVDTAFWQWNDVWLSQEFREFDIRDICKYISCPVLAIQGREDLYGSLRQINDIAPQGYIDRIVLEGCGHTPFKESELITRKSIKEFINKL